MNSDTRAFNPSRLELARKRRKLTKLELSRLTGITTKSFVEYEKGTMRPRQDTVEVLSTVLGFPPEFFYGDDLELPEVDVVSFRSFKKMTAATRDCALAASAIGVSLYEWIADRFDLPEPDLPEARGASPEAAADMLRQVWSLGERPLKNLVQRLELKGVRVLSLAESTHDMDAFSFWRGDRPYVFLNTAKSAERSRFDVAHELGHLVLHRHASDTKHIDAEREADMFASALLLPRSSMLSISPQECTLRRLIEIKQYWQVSLAALVYRLHQIGTIRDWHYRNLCIEMSKIGYFQNEPLPLPREMSQVMQKILDALRSDGFSKADIAKDLEISEEELDKLMFRLAILPIAGGNTSSPTKRRSPVLSLIK